CPLDRGVRVRPGAWMADGREEDWSDEVLESLPRAVVRRTRVDGRSRGRDCVLACLLQRAPAQTGSPDALGCGGTAGSAADRTGDTGADRYVPGPRRVHAPERRPLVGGASTLLPRRDRVTCREQILRL